MNYITPLYVSKIQTQRDVTFQGSLIFSNLTQNNLKLSFFLLKPTVSVTKISPFWGPLHREKKITKNAISPLILVLEKK